METVDTSGGWFDKLLSVGGAYAGYDLRREQIEGDQLNSQYKLLELQAEQKKAADVNNAITGRSFFQDYKPSIIFVGALIFTGLMIYKVVR